MKSFAPVFNRRLFLLGSAGVAVPALAQAPAKKAEIVFRVDEKKMGAVLVRRLSARLQILFPDHHCNVSVGDKGGAWVSLLPNDPEAIRSDQFIGERSLDPAPMTFFETMPRLGVFMPAVNARRLSDGARIDKGTEIDVKEPALAAQAALWRDRARKMLEAALAPRKPVFANRDASTFSLTLEGMDQKQWSMWIGARIDLFTPIPFSLAPVALTPDAMSFYPRPAPRGGLDLKLAVDAEKQLDNADDIFLARVEGEGASERLILDVTSAGADGWAARKPPLADKAAYALMFDKALAALAVLDGPASTRHLRFRIEKGSAAAELAERILLGGSAPQVRQVEAKFG